VTPPPGAPIPELDVGGAWPLEALDAALDRAHALLDAQPAALRPVLALADRVSRAWLARSREPYLLEVDAIAARIGRPGAHFLNVSYDWGCSTVAAPGPGGGPPRLARVLDWPTPGLGRFAVLVRVAAQPGGPGGFAALTWPGYTGVLQGVAPGRFAAALNQAPMRRAVGFAPADRAANALGAWRRPRLTPAHLLRRAFETAPDFAAARAMLAATPLSSGAIFVLAGVNPGETAVIERQPDRAATPPGPAAAANDWRTPGWTGRPRGDDNPGRLAAIAALAPGFDDPAAWLRPPVLNANTRLVFVGEAAGGAYLAQGFEALRTATPPLRGVAR
jgi:hypothetical protein